MRPNQRDGAPTFALIGAGFIFDRHLAAIEEVGGRLLAVIDNDPSKQDKLDTGVEFWTDSNLFFEISPLAQEVEYIVICTPNYTHYPLIIQALSEGKTVLCEKPGVITTGDLKSLASVQSKTLSKVFFVHQLRESATLQKLRQRLQLSSASHQVTMTLRMTREDFYWNGWKGQKDQSGGILFNIGVHYLDLLIWLFGEPTDSEVLARTDRMAKLKLSFKHAACDFEIDLTTPKDQQVRLIEIDGERLNLTRILESLHVNVYESLINDEGTTIKDIGPTITLCEQLSLKPCLAEEKKL